MAVQINEAQKNDIMGIDKIAQKLFTQIKETEADPRCKALALTKLEECQMWANRGIAIRSEKQ